MAVFGHLGVAQKLGVCSVAAPVTSTVRYLGAAATPWLFLHSYLMWYVPGLVVFTM